MRHGPAPASGSLASTRTTATSRAPAALGCAAPRSLVVRALRLDGPARRPAVCSAEAQGPDANSMSCPTGSRVVPAHRVDQDGPCGQLVQQARLAYAWAGPMRGHAARPPVGCPGTPGRLGRSALSIASADRRSPRPLQRADRHDGSPRPSDRAVHLRLAGRARPSTFGPPRTPAARAPAARPQGWSAIG